MLDEEQTNRDNFTFTFNIIFHFTIAHKPPGIKLQQLLTSMHSYV
jgi:hypothetical protein